MDELTWDKCKFFGFYVDKQTGNTMFVPVITIRESDGMPIFDTAQVIEGSLADLIAEAPDIQQLYRMDDPEHEDDSVDTVADALETPGTHVDAPSIGTVSWE